MKHEEPSTNAVVSHPAGKFASLVGKRATVAMPLRPKARLHVTPLEQKNEANVTCVGAFQHPVAQEWQQAPTCSTLLKGTGGIHVA